MRLEAIAVVSHAVLRLDLLDNVSSRSGPGHLGLLRCHTPTESTSANTDRHSLGTPKALH